VGIVNLDRRHETSAPVVGQPAPDLSGTTLDGASVHLADLRGRPVIVNFWASWCIPCREEFPLLRTELQSHAADGLAVIGVLFKDQPAPASTFVAQFGATWPTVTDPDEKLAVAFRVVAPPQSYFIDRNGILRSIQIGALPAADFERQYGAIAN
jgi:cytochrome c biogenesis protein CcmG/thiol:disulfide interchange protein DsbE